MELVYLWVVKYKNIEKQGFNFSPRFRCEYDEESKNLTIDENDDYVDIFPDNINVTAIVGENGSGKSSIFKKILDILDINDNEDNCDFILLYLYDNELFVCKNSICQINTTEKLTESNHSILKNHQDLISLYINNQNETIKSGYSEQLFIEKSQNTKRYINSMIISNYMKKDLLINKISEEFFQPKKVIIKIQQDHFLFNILNEDQDYYSEDVWKEIDSLKAELNQSSFFKRLEIIVEIFKIKKNKHIEVPNFTLMNGKIDKQYFNKYTISEDFLENILSKIKEDESVQDYYEIDISEVNDDIFSFIQQLPYIFDIDLVDEDISFNNLSYGERQLLIQLNFILFYIRKKEYEEYFHYKNEEDEYDGYNNYEIDKIIVFIDEFELGLHPNWQKQFISYLVKFFKDSDKQFNIIINSHSPFILSDLPKENVIFLKDGKQIDALEKKETFGANIHTLLSDGFFMSDGLMGEFAKGRIDEVIELLNINRKLEDDELKLCKDIVSIIGEPILKKQLQKMLDNKLQLSNKDEIDILKEEMEFIKHRIEILRKNK